MNITPADSIPFSIEERDIEKEKRTLEHTRAHACQMPGAIHFYGNDGRCVFCSWHRDPAKR